MRVLSFMGPSNDGQRLLLQADDGTQFELTVDDRLVSVVSREHGSPTRAEVTKTTPTVQLPPREIQERVRHGASIDDVAASAGVAVSQIERFAHPVMTERQHVAQRASDSMVKVGSKDMKLGEAVEMRLENDGLNADQLHWDAWRQIDGTWSVTATYPAPSYDKLATFDFNLAERALTPSNAEARLILAEPKAVAAPAPAPTSASASPSPSSESGSESGSASERSGTVPVQASAPPATEKPSPSHPAARALQRREDAEKGHPAGSRPPAPKPPKPSMPTPATNTRTQIEQTPHWEELLFGSPTNDSE